MPISFNQIGISNRVPRVLSELDATKATQGLGIQPYKALLIGQKIAAGVKNALNPFRLTSPAQAQQYFGEGSMLHRQAIAWFAENTSTEVFAIAMNDPSGATKAVHSITVTGPATAAGTLALYVNGERLQIGVAAGDTAIEVATAIQAALAAKTALPIDSEINASDDFIVDITAKNAGLLGNELDLRVNYYQEEQLPAGVGITFAVETAGAGVPDFATLWPPLGDEHYNILVIPYTDSASLNAITAEMDSRAGPDRQIEGMVFAHKDDTHSALGTFGSTKNNEWVSIMTPPGPSSPTPSVEWGASYAAVAAFYLAIDPARPLQTLEMSHVLPPANGSQFTADEQNLLLFDGLATSYIDSAGNVRIQRAITTYQENDFGAEDAAYLDVNTLFTLSFLRWSVRNRILLKYPRHKLANDGTKFGRGQAVVTPLVMKAEMVALFQEWESLGLVEGVEQFVRDLIVERNANDPNRLDVLLPPDLVNQLRITALQLQFRV